MLIIKANFMKKRIILYSMLIALIMTSCNSSGDGEYDSRAVDTLDKLTETIGGLNSLSYTIESYSSDEEGNVTKKTSDAYLKGPNKLFIDNRGPQGTKNFWYNGDTFSYFLFDKNEYDILDAPENTLAVIDSIHSTYGIYFPAADFLYPTLTDDVLSNYDQLLYYGEEKVDGVDCIVLEASNENNIVGIWIEKESNLPHKMTVESLTNENKYYEAVYINWRKDPKLLDIMFEFQAPSNSVQKKLK